MAIDRGGLQYRIQIDGNFASQLALFRSELAAVQRDWAEFRANVQAVGKASGAATKGVSDLADATGELGIVAGEAAAAEKKLADNEVLRKRVIGSLNNEVEKLAVAQEKELLIAEQRSLLADRSLIALRGETRAIRAVNAALEKQVTERQKVALANQLGLKGLFDSKKALTAEAIAAERSAKAQKELAVQRILAAQGLDRGGRPIPDGPSFGPKTRQEVENDNALAAQKKFNAELAREQQKSLLAELKANSPEWRKLQNNAAAAGKEVAKTTKEFEGLEGRINRVSFTFRRLFGILAAFTIVRESVAGFANLIRTSVVAAAQLEQTSLGIAGLLTSLAQIDTLSQGATEGTQKFAAAQRETAGILGRLRKVAQETAGSYQEIIDTFQQALAPGLTAGLNIKEIEEVTKLVSQTAGAIGLQQNQLNQEIRALLTGEGSAINTRLFQTGLFSPEAIKQARELGGPGGLMDLIRTRLKGIALAGKAALGTLAVEASNASDAFRLLLGESSAKFADQLKKAARAFRETIENDATDQVVSDPKALSAFQALFDGIARGVEAVTSSIRTLDLAALRTFLGSVGDAIGLTIVGLSNVVRFLIEGTAPVLAAFRSILEAVRQVASGLDALTGGGLSEFSGNIARAAVAFIATVAALSGAAKVLAVLKTGSNLLKLAATATAAKWLVIRRNIFDAASSTAVLVKNAKLFSKQFLVVTAVLSILLLVAEKFDLLGAALDGIKTVLDPLTAKIEEVYDKLFGTNVETGSSIANVAQAVSAAIQLTDEAAQELLERVREVARTTKAELATVGLSAEAAARAERVAEALKQADSDSTRLILLRNQLLQQQKRAQEEVASFVNFANKQDTEAAALKKGLQNANRKEEVANIEKLLGLQQNLNKIKAAQEELGTAFVQSEFKSDIAAIEKSYGSIEKAAVSVAAELQGIASRSSALKSVIDLGQTSAAASREADKAGLLVTQTQRGINDIENELTSIKKRNLAIALEQLRVINAQRAVEVDIERRQTQLNIGQLQRRAQVEASGSQARLELLEGVEQVETKLLQLQLAREQFNRDEVGYSKTLQELREAGLDDSQAFVDTERLINEERELGSEKTREIAEQLGQASRRLQEIRLQQSDAVPEGLLRGAQAFVDGAALFQTAQQFATEGLAGIGSTVGSQVAAEFDPDQNAEWDKAFGKLALRLGQTLVEDAINRVLAGALTSLFPSLAGGATQGAAAGALASAGATIAAASSSLLVSAGLLTQGSAALAIGASQASFASVGLVTASAAWAPVAATLLAAGLLLSTSGIGFAQGGPVGFAKGGPAAPGFAVGGRTPTRHNFGRSRGLDPRDTIPAWLRFGEWIIRPEATGYYGDGVLQAINSMRIPASTLRALAGVSGRTTAKIASSPGFAQGGPAAAAAGIVKDNQPRQGQGTQPVVILHDRQQMDQLLAGGRSVLHRYARRDRSELRTALGI
jgi:hypothetical protein